MNVSMLFFLSVQPSALIVQQHLYSSGFCWISVRFIIRLWDILVLLI